MDCEDKFVFRDEDLPTKSYVFFQTKREEFCDITFQVGERSISAHRIILSAAIPYFHNMFCEKEAPNSQQNIITLPDADPDALESLIDFAYTCQIEINNVNVEALMCAACLLQQDQVREECFRFLSNKLHPENALKTRDFLSKLNSPEEQGKVNSYIIKNFEEVSRTADFQKISFDILKDVIEDDDLNVRSEERVFEIIMKWLKQCPEERDQHLPHLLSTVRMTFIKPSYIRNNILKEDLIRTSPECRDLMDEALYYHFVPEEREGVCSFITRPRSFASGDHKKEVDEIPHFYILYSKMKHRVQSLDSENAKWKTVINYDFDFEYQYTACELNKRMYMFLPEFTYIYNVEENSFSFCKGMTLPRFCAASVSHEKKLYVIGGCVSDARRQEASNSVECFDPNTQEWTLLSEMNICRTAPGAVACAGFIYSLGGADAYYRVFSSVEKYDAKTGMWIMMTPMLSERCAPGCAMFNDKIYVCGGIRPNDVLLSTVELFDPVTNEWKFVSSMNTARVNCKLIPFCGKLYSIGGETEDGNSTAVEIYEPEVNKWKHGSPVKENLTVWGAAVVNMAQV